MKAVKSSAVSKKIDGLLNDEARVNITPAEVFTNNNPNYGKSSSRATKVS